MNLTKKQMIIAAIVIGAVAVWYFFIRKKKMESSYNEDVLIIGNENGYGGARSYGGASYGESSFLFDTNNPLKNRRMTQRFPSSNYDGSNEGQMCHKDHHCSPGLYCKNNRCTKKRRVASETLPPKSLIGIR